MLRLLSALIPLLLPLTLFAQEPPKTRIIFIGKDPDHPHGTHMYMHVSGVLKRCVERTAGVEGIVSKGWPKDADSLRGVKAIVLYTDPGAEFLLDGAHREAAEKMLDAGVGVTTIHWASSIRKADVDRLGPLWLKHMGGTWVSNVGLSWGKAKLQQVDLKHPISRGWTEFDFEDEFYLDPTIKSAKPLLQVREPKGKDVVVGWTYERPGGGRSFSTTLGHFYKNFENDSFRRMIVNGVLWSAGVDVPETGASIDVDAETLALPKK